MSNRGEKARNPTWGARFTSSLHPQIEKYTSSLMLDKRLASYDVKGSRAHVKMLAHQGILSPDDRDLLLAGLDQVEQEIESGDFPYRNELEDIHMNVEWRLQEIVGEAGARVHTGRSRNDQIALDLKLFCRASAQSWQCQLTTVVQTLVTRAERLKGKLFPAWTHLQSAQPLSWGHYLLAFCEMFGRDFRRLSFYQQLHSSSPLGAGALAGSSLSLAPEQVAEELHFSSSFGNSYDAVGDRDFVLELLQIASQLMLHVSRLATDFIHFYSTPVSWIELSDTVCTGSSMMPQKKNPDVLELARGKTSSVLGHTAALANLIKGLPSSYHRDLQQDKEHLFGAADTVTETLEILPLILSDFEVRTEHTQEALKTGFLMATDLAEHLVTKGVPFREAHQKVGRIVAYCLDQKLDLETLSLQEIKKFAPQIVSEVNEVLKPANTLNRRRHKGSTGLVSIERQIAFWKQWLLSANRRTSENEQD